MKNLMQYLNNLEVTESWGECYLDDGSKTSDRSYRTNTEAYDMVDDFRNAILALDAVKDFIRFISDNEVFTISDFDFDLLDESIQAIKKDNLTGLITTGNFFETIVLQKNAYAAFCDICDYANNWGIFEDVFSASTETERKIMGSYSDNIVLVWNDNDGDFQIIDNEFIVNATVNACGLN